METEFITYKKFNDVALANELAELLNANNIKYSLEEEAPSFDPSFAYARIKEYILKVGSNDFEQVNTLLKQNANKDIEGVDGDYYLKAFSNDELMEVVTKADEWNAFDVQLARKLLTERGNTISDDEIAGIEQKRIEELKVPEPSQTTWVILGYVIAIGGVAMPFFISIIGFFIGWHLSSHKKTLPDGERVYAYSNADRKNGKWIFYVGIALFLIKLLIFIYEFIF